MKMRNDRHWLTVAAAAGIVAVVASQAAAQRKYDLGASDTEIKIGDIMPYSGPASATVDSQIINPKASGADIFFDVTTPKFASRGHQENRGAWLETSPPPRQSLCLGRRNAQACWLG
jgi:hypothetical protein